MSYNNELFIEEFSMNIEVFKADVTDIVFIVRE